MCNIKFANNNIRECVPFAKFAKIIDHEHFAKYSMQWGWDGMMQCDQGLLLHHP